jgi:hypothetical protein
VIDTSSNKSIGEGIEQQVLAARHQFLPVDAVGSLSDLLAGEGHHQRVVGEGEQPALQVDQHRYDDLV